MWSEGTNDYTYQNSSDLPDRIPVAVALTLGDNAIATDTLANVDVLGSWVNKQNMTQVSQKYGRIINNVSIAFPHAGVAMAAVNSSQGDLLSQELFVSPPASFI